MPGGTVTVAGTVADLLSLFSATIAPEGPAGPVRVTVPVDVAPPGTVPGDRLIPDSTGGRIVRDAVWLMPGTTVTVCVASASTGTVDTMNVTEVAPLGTVTADGTEMIDPDEVRFTEKPPEGATILSVRDPVAVCPPTTEPGEIESFATWMLSRQ